MYPEYEVKDISSGGETVRRIPRPPTGEAPEHSEGEGGYLSKE